MRKIYQMLFRYKQLLGEIVKRIIMLVCIGFMPCSLFAATLETLVSALALPASANYSANDWSSINAISGVRWSHKGLRQTPVSSFTRLGQIKLERLGNVGVFFSGERTMVFQLDITVGEVDGNVFEKEQFTSVLRSQFNKGSAIKNLHGGCRDEGEVSGSAVYEVTLPTKKPVYVLVTTDSGGNSPNSRTSGFQFMLELEDRWKCR